MYAVTSDGKSWRAITSEADLLPGETATATPPPSEPEEGEQLIFVKPIVTPAVYAEDIFVSSRDIKDDPLEALAEALTETKKGKGEPKSLDMIARSTLKALEHAMKEIDKLRLEVEQLKKKVK